MQRWEREVNGRGEGRGEKEKKDGGEELGLSWVDGNGSVPKPPPAWSPLPPAPLRTERLHGPTGLLGIHILGGNEKALRP